MEKLESKEILRKEAIASYNTAFDEYEKGADNHRAIELANTSLYLWRQVGNDENLAIAYWLLSRIYVKSQLGLLAIECAEKSRQHLAAIESPADWLVASIHEGWARALVAIGDNRAAEAIHEAKGLIAAIADSEDRALIEGQFSTLV